MELIEIPENPAPSGAVASSLLAIDGMNLRVARWLPKGEARGTVTICQGRAEFIEKYFETVGELLARGLAVVAFDWRGQGLSGRDLDDARKGHIDDFLLYQRDLDAVVEQALEPFCPRPWFALGHSMGGAILLAQARHGASPFERLVLTAPMVALRSGRMPGLARALAETLDVVGLGGAFMPGGGGASALARPFESNLLTSDETRYRRNAAIAAAAPRLAIGAPTIGWVNAAFRLTRLFADDEYPRRVLTPTLVFAAGDERVTDPRALEHFATRLKAGRHLVLNHARHEILMENDTIRALFWRAFDTYIPGARDELAAMAAAQDWTERARSRGAFWR